MENRYLFRGKRIDNGEWVEGHLITDEKDDLKCFIGYIMGTDEDGTPHDLDVVQVDSTTICQCTGLKDKNGKLIWENDVIRCNYKTSIVKWEKSEWRIKWIDEDVWRRDLDYWVNESKREVNVVGNIFDNPELLEE